MCYFPVRTFDLFPSQAKKKLILYKLFLKYIHIKSLHPFIRAKYWYIRLRFKILKKSYLQFLRRGAFMEMEFLIAVGVQQHNLELLLITKYIVIIVVHRYLTNNFHEVSLMDEYILLKMHLKLCSCIRWHEQYFPIYVILC